MHPADTETLELLPAGIAPRQLFILLPAASAEQADMLPLAAVLGESFPEAAVVVVSQLLPAVTLNGLPVPVANLSDHSGGRALSAELASLLAFVRAQQERWQLLQSDTALAGFGDAASLALEFSDRFDGVVGRVLAFSGAYSGWKDTAPGLTTLHLLHGGADSQVPLARVREGFQQLTALGADATLDVARGVGHELHPALMEQAVLRLQTCVPLRHWRAAAGG
ncbi:MAG: esterase [Pseudomonadota bacterium]